VGGGWRFRLYVVGEVLSRSCALLGEDQCVCVVQEAGCFHYYWCASQAAGAGGTLCMLR
jgi:hypothetical protein